LAEWHAERAPLNDEHFVACQATAVVGIVLREVADAIGVEWERRRTRNEASGRVMKPREQRLRLSARGAVFETA
jgi:hypothetical protein